MILFDLLCSKEHRFEGWFRSGDTFDAQIAAGEVACPVCGDTEVHKALSAPALLRGKVGSRAEGIAIKMREALTELRQRVVDNCDYVGDRFPEEARGIHYGEKKERPGQDPHGDHERNRYPESGRTRRK